MELVIDIDEELYNDIKQIQIQMTAQCYYHVMSAIVNGTPLPKGHGDLIDRGKLKTHFIGTDLGTDLEVYLEPTIMEAPTIIEADKIESEE